MREGYELTLSHGSVFRIVPHNSDECAIGNEDFVVYVNPADGSHRVVVSSRASTKAVMVTSIVKKSFEDFTPAPKTGGTVGILKACIKCHGSNCCVTNCCAQCAPGCPWICDE